MSAFNAAIPIAKAVAVDEAYSAPPSAPPAIAPLPSLQNEGGAREFLSSKQWPAGLQDAFIENIARTPLRFFICDDSGSMQTNDGNLVAMVGGATMKINCTRWRELTEALKFHVAFAQAAQAPSEFRLLNAQPPLRVGFHPSDAPNVDKLLSAFSQSPAGGTPLCRHIREIAAEIRAVEEQLRSAGQKACVIIATDGEASDGNVAEVLRPLKELPCWVILRFCTGEERIVNYWNDIDQQLELNMDVLDDLAGEAKEIHKMNSWLAYGEPMHRMREFGVSMKEIDLLDERQLSLEYLRKICKLIYGKQVDDLPMPETDWKGFCRGIEALNSTVPPVWSAGHDKMRHWVTPKSLNRVYKGAGCTIM